MASSRSSNATLIGLSIAWGSSWIANEMLRNQAPPLQLAGERYLLAGIIVLLAHGWQQFVGRKAPSEPPSPTSGSWIGISLLLGLTMFGIPDLLLVLAAAHGVGAFTPLVYSALPLGLLLCSGDLRTPAIIGVGAMLAVLNGSLSFSASRLGWVLLIALAVALQGCSLVFARRNLAIVSSLRSVTIQLVTAACILLPFARFPLFPPQESSLAALFILAGVATSLAYPLYYRLLRDLEPFQIATSEWLQTLVAIAESALLLHQRPGWPLVAAAGVLIGCAVLLLRPSAAFLDLGLQSSSPK